jgi:hypothetical protein
MFTLSESEGIFAKYLMIKIMKSVTLNILMIFIIKSDRKMFILGESGVIFTKHPMIILRSKL